MRNPSSNQPQSQQAIDAHTNSAQAGDDPTGQPTDIPPDHTGAEPDRASHANQNQGMNQISKSGR